MAECRAEADLDDGVGGAGGGSVVACKKRRRMKGFVLVLSRIPSPLPIAFTLCFVYALGDSRRQGGHLTPLLHEYLPSNTF